MAVSGFHATTVDNPHSSEKVSVGRQMMRRSVNDRMRVPHSGSDEAFEVFCECGRAICHDGAYVTADLYDMLRRFPTHFLVSYSHRGESERIVESHGDFAIVEKFGRSGLEAIKFDRALRSQPRGSGTDGG